MLKIFGVSRSRASRIIWLCHEIGLPFDQVPVIQSYRLAEPLAPDARLNTASPDFLALSPAGAVPVIEDGDVVLSESLACTIYLARKYGGDLGPADAGEDGLMLQWSFYGATAIEEDALTLMLLERAGRVQTGEDQALIAHAAEQLIRPMAVVEANLARHPFLIGDRFTVADLNLAEIIRYAQHHAPLMDQFPATRFWLEKCQSRPAFGTMWSARMAEPE